MSSGGSCTAEANSAAFEPKCCILQGFNLKHEDRARAEAVIALIVGVGFLRQRVKSPALTALDPEQLTELLSPYIASMLTFAE